MRVNLEMWIYGDFVTWLKLNCKRSWKNSIELRWNYLIQIRMIFFYFIAGYTAGGAPYGITWEQARKDGLIESHDEDGTDELPFD